MEAKRRRPNAMSAAYLSPIMSSGDSTPPLAQQEREPSDQLIASEQIRQPQQQYIKQAPINPFQTRVELSSVEIANKLRQNKLKSQLQRPKQKESGARPKKNSFSSMLNESSSNSDDDDHHHHHHQLEQREVAKAVVLNCFSGRQRGANSFQLDEDEDEDEEQNTADEQEEDERESSEEQRKRIRLTGTNNNNNNNKTTNNQHTATAIRQHEQSTLAEQFLERQQQPAAARAKGSASGSSSASADSFSLNYDANWPRARRLRGLFAGFSSRGSSLLAGEKLNKKFTQILQSIPMVPTLVATTSIMTLLLILCLLLLSDTPRATALRNHELKQAHELAGQDHQMAEQQQQQQSRGSGELTWQEERAKDARDKMQSMLADEQAQQREEAANRLPAGEGLKAAGLTKEALRRELINDLLLTRARSHQQQRHPQAPHGSNGRLPPQLAHVRSSTKRNGGAQFEQPPSGGDSLRLGEEPAPAEVGNLFDSLGSMLFGAAQQQQQQQQVQPVRPVQQPEATQEASEQLDAGSAFLDGGPAPGATMLRAAADGGGGGGSEPGSGEQEPARLRTSALELELSPDQYNSLQGVAAGPSTRPRAQHRARAAPNQQPPPLQQQHDSNSRHHASNHQRAFDVAQIQCNNTEEGFERFACPTPDFYGRFRCIEDRLFCDGYYDCPGGEDEERVHCMYYRLNQNRQVAAAAGGAQHQSVTGQQHQHQHVTNGFTLDT